MKRKKVAREDSFSALAEDIFGDGPFIELRGRREISVQGCRCILVCTETEVLLRLRDANLHLEGNGLRCTTYFSGAVSVHGEITLLRFDEIV